MDEWTNELTWNQQGFVLIITIISHSYGPSRKAWKRKDILGVLQYKLDPSLRFDCGIKFVGKVKKERKCKV